MNDGAVMLIGLAIAATAGVLVAKDATARGMSPAWGLGVFLLCLVFLPLYLLLRKPLVRDTPATPVHSPRPSSSQVVMRPEQTVPAGETCANCGRQFEPGSRFCSGCGRAIV